MIKSSTNRMDQSGPAHSPTLQTPDVYEETEYNPTCNTFTIIHEHLERNYHALALLTLEFPIAEHVLLRHIQQTDLDLSPTEWRAFLRRCERLGTLFRYVRDNSERFSKTENQQ